MSDVLLTRIAVALEAIAASGGNAVASPQPSTGTGGSGANTAQVTNDMLLALVQPLVQNEGTKEQVKAVLTKHGLNRLGEAQEAQYPTLYAEFKAIADAPAAGGGSGDLI